MRAKDSHHQEVPVPIANGRAKIRDLRNFMRCTFCQPGNNHWGTPMDIALLAEALNVGIIIFSSRSQGRGRDGTDKWIYGVNLARGDFPFWITLYNSEDGYGRPVHFQVAELTSQGPNDVEACYFSTSALPDALVTHYNQCNDKSVGEESQGGVS